MDVSLVIYGLLAAAAGTLASSNVVIEKLPNAKQYLEKMVPYQAIIGVVAMVLSVMKLFDVFSNRYLIFTNLIILTCVLSYAVVGFLLGYPMVQQFFANEGEKYKEKTEEFRKKLAPYQVIAGLIAIGTGAYLILSGIFIK